MSGKTLSTLQALACFVIATAGLVPMVLINRPFYGLSTLALDGGLPTVFFVEPESPAASAGLILDDEVLSANGSTASESSLEKALNGLHTGETLPLRVNRGGTELNLSATGGEPQIAWIYYSTVWHPGAGAIALVLGLIVLAARPPRPIPRRLASFVTAGGLCLTGIFLYAIATDGPYSYFPVRQYHMLNWGAQWQFEQNWVGLVASILLLGLGGWQLLGARKAQVLANG